MTFGKHKGTAIADLPQSYVDWFLKQADVDKYLEIALRKRK
jgi:exodeoxyribonuclease X